MNSMEKDQLPITCPICGRKKSYPVGDLVEGSEFACPVCKLKLKLHGHMWEDIQRELAKLKKGVEPGEGLREDVP
jgi:C4-type Zn-finger protein